jgi:hypothetical protein
MEEKAPSRNWKLTSRIVLDSASQGLGRVAERAREVLGAAVNEKALSFEVRLGVRREK